MLPTPPLVCRQERVLSLLAALQASNQEASVATTALRRAQREHATAAQSLEATRKRRDGLLAALRPYPRP